MDLEKEFDNLVMEMRNIVSDRYDKGVYSYEEYLTLNMMIAKRLNDEDDNNFEPNFSDRGWSSSSWCGDML
jgi:hypothetical protein